MACGFEPAGYPFEKLFLALLLKADLPGVLLQGCVELFVGFVGLVFYLVVDKDQTAVGREVLQQGDQARPLFLAELVEVPVHHLHHGASGHHGHGLHRLRQSLDGQPFALQLVVVEVLKAGYQILFQLREVELPQIALLTAENIDGAGLPRGEGVFELRETGVGGFLLHCHKPASSFSNFFPL